GGNVRIAVKYKLRVESNSGLNALSPVASQFLPFSFWYPTPTSWYFPEGGDAAPFTISVKGLGGRDFVSAGDLRSGAYSTGLEAMPFFATGKWSVSEHAGVSVFAPAGTAAVESRPAELAQIAAEARKYFEGVFGRPIGTPIRIVAVSRGSGFSNAGTVFVDRGAFMTRSLDSKSAVAISEGIAKTMVGNTIAVRGPGYGIVSEGLSRHISNRFIEQKYGKSIGRIVRLRQLTNYVAIADKDGPLNIVSPVDGYFYSATGNKGSMIWNYLHHKYGDDFYPILRTSSEDGELTLSELRSVFSVHKVFLDHSVDNVTSMNLMIGNPRREGGVTKSALRNVGEIDAAVRVVGFDRAGKEFSQNVVIPAKNFSEAKFESGDIVRVEVDPEKLYPQLSLKDDIAPRTIEDDDPLVFIKREFDRQRFADAEMNARTVLVQYPDLDDAMVFLGRSLLALGKLTDAKLEFEKVLASKLPSPQSIAWSLVGAGDTARKMGQLDSAIPFYAEAIRADAEYGATLAARNGRAEAGGKTDTPAEVTAFFANFDKAVVANSKNAVESLILEGEIARFSSNVAGQAQAWTTQIIAVDKVDDENWLVETNLNVKLLNRQEESGLAVFRLSKVNGGLKLSGVEIFEVR
ncbi:MAG: tetratricopeptide repeat protein, partial [Acidobacteriota bacterium]|nr:tetratricopeptide repeat protein [Acidobacteriota bacterium]